MEIRMEEFKRKFVISCSKDYYTGRVTFNAETIPVKVKFNNPGFQKIFNQIKEIKNQKDRRLQQEDDKSTRDSIDFQANRRINSILMNMDASSLKNFYNEYHNGDTNASI